MPTKIKNQLPSSAIRAKLKAENRPVLVSFSLGKDAIATELALADEGIETVLAYMYLIPPDSKGKHLSFVQDSLDKLEQQLGKRIHTYPHPSLYRWLNGFVMQPPERLAVIQAAEFPPLDYPTLWELIKEDLGLPADTWVADGVRAADSIVRRASLSRHGVMKASSRKVSPIADWLKAEVLDCIESHGIDLPVDYELFGRSFDGLDYRFLKPIKDNLPQDYERILEWFPLVEMEILRNEL